MCFHAQQCAEKCLKAVLTHRGHLVPRAHKIDDLWCELPAETREVLAPLREGLVELDTYHTTTRYPDAAAGARPEGLPGGRHAERALETAPRCWEVVRDLVG